MLQDHGDPSETSGQWAGLQSNKVIFPKTWPMFLVKIGMIGWNMTVWEDILRDERESLELKAYHLSLNGYFGKTPAFSPKKLIIVAEHSLAGAAGKNGYDLAALGCFHARLHGANNEAHGVQECLEALVLTQGTQTGLRDDLELETPSWFVLTRNSEENWISNDGDSSIELEIYLDV